MAPQLVYQITLPDGDTLKYYFDPAIADSDKPLTIIREAHTKHFFISEEIDATNANEFYKWCSEPLQGNLLYHYRAEDDKEGAKIRSMGDV
ncbi:hypothetical protein BDV96DRAFT_639733 [Lophiotrema nucula]|uniref:Uncharacterized protein n=1 Tax=Lophiotrema nucula TaxID=690887 RepID=A0A6A5ZU64_9PLEO|nr:hypothetical protein BDV96DRAFT_639733 [Lophiotrema nucula]